MFKYVPDRFKTQEMCDYLVRKHCYMSEDAPDRLKTKEMCDVVVKMDSYLFYVILNQFKTLKMCKEVVQDDPILTECVLDWFVRGKMFKKCQNEGGWFEVSKQHKAQKIKIKEELLYIAWNSDRVIE